MTLKNSPQTPPAAPPLDGADMDKMMASACDASALLKAISHEGRLMILCALVDGEKSVSELEELLHARQAAVSQQLARLRLEGLVSPRREGKTIFYSLADERPKRLIGLMYEMFCLTPTVEPRTPEPRNEET
ncbi:MAG: transcriptional regulator [Rhodobacterales bacterium]|nr:MAG: transcriptional regulator [Rhodobacterales bacterium]